jgi:hypothetical protein
MGTKLGVIVGDFHTKVFDSKMRCYDLTRLINAVLYFLLQAGRKSHENAVWRF